VAEYNPRLHNPKLHTTTIGWHICPNVTPKSPGHLVEKACFTELCHKKHALLHLGETMEKTFYETLLDRGMSESEATRTTRHVADEALKILDHYQRRFTKIGIALVILILLMAVETGLSFLITIGRI
jgi:hypothetical protein